MEQIPQIVSERFARVEMRMSDAEMAQAQTTSGLSWGIYRLFVVR